MKTHALMLTLVFSCLIPLKSQEITIPDSLIGTWKYKGPDRISVNDTIELEKGTLKDNDYELWTFRPYRNRLEITLKSEYKGPNSIVATRIDAWLYNKSSKILTLKISEYKHEFRIVSCEQHILKLRRIK